MAPIRVVLVDDHHVVRRGLRSLLESFPDLAVVGEAASGEEAVAAIPAWNLDVVVMDLLMPGGIDGIEATRRLRLQMPGIQVVVLTSYTDEARVIAALRVGAIGYVRKDAGPDVLLTAIRAAARGQSLLDPSVAGAVFHHLERRMTPGEGLTEREGEVLRQIALGRTNREIAGDLVVSAETVKTHVANILSKLGLANRTQVIIYALKQGIVTLDEITLDDDPN
jgi:NarL family two-component system response regulator LiaR